MANLTGAQKAAVLLLHMGKERSAAVLRSLSEAEVEHLMAETMQSDIAHRIATMERTSPEVVRQVEQVLERKLSSVLQASESTQAAGGLQALVDLLTRSDRATEKLILTELEKRDAELAEQVRGQM